MVDKKQANLRELINYVNGKNPTMDKVVMLASVTITACMIAKPVLGAAVSTGYTILGTNLPSGIKGILNLITNKSKEDTAVAAYWRCKFTEVVLSRLAVMQAIEINLNGKDKLLAEWKISRHIDEQQLNEINTLDEKRELNFIQEFYDQRIYNREEYWDELLQVMIGIMDLSADEIPAFHAKMKLEISHAYEAFKNQVICESEVFKNYLTFTIGSEVNGRILDKLNELVEFVNIYGNMYMTIDEVDRWIKESTEPSFGLDFYNYEEDAFVHQFIDQLSSKSVINVKGKTREEVVFYILYIIKNIEKIHEKDTYIVETIEKWNALKEKCKGKVLIPNFNASVVDIIPGNINIIAYSDEDFIGNKNPIELPKRILSNMHQMLHKEVDDLETVSTIVNKSNGLYTTFKRMVFKGKTGKPKWEETSNRSLVPALLIGQWTDKKGDSELISRLAKADYHEYIKSINSLIGGEDPFLLKINHFGNENYKLANVEEAWEILFKHISSEDMEILKGLAIELLIEVSPKFHLPLEDHYRASILGAESIYSDSMKEGIIRSFIMLANMDGLQNHFHVASTQKWVDDLLRNVFDQIDSSEKWFSISEHLPDIAEASPTLLLSVLENETKKVESPIWELFEKTGDGWFGGRNYYTHVLWALEKLLAFEDSAPRAVKVLATLAERKVTYKISNSPLSTLNHALCAWLHEVNVSLNEKVKLTDYIVRKSAIGWELLEQLLPDRSPGHTLMGMTKPKYRSYRIQYELKYKKEIFDTYREYTRIAIREAKDDLAKWRVLVKKCFFFELGLGDEVIAGVINAIQSCDSDSVKFGFKDEVRDLIYNHRFYRSANWALKEEYIARIEEEVFNGIQFANKIYDYLYLFNTDRPHSIQPIPYDEERYNYTKSQENLRALRFQAIDEIMKDPNLTISNLLIHLLDNNENIYGLRAIGEIMASEFHNYAVDFTFLNNLLKIEKKTVFLYYIGTIYENKGLIIIKELFKKIELDHDLAADVLRLAMVNEEFLEFLETCDSIVKKNYWARYWNRTAILNDSVREVVWNKLLEYQNYSSALDLVRDGFTHDILKHIQLLEKILVDPGDYKVIAHDQYDIREVFKSIYKADSLNEELKQKIFNLEIGYFDFLRDGVKPKYLMTELKQNPRVLADLIRYAYKTSDESDQQIEVSKEMTRLGEIAFRILFNLKFCPCVDEAGNISIEELRDWTQTYLRIVDGNKQSVIGRQLMGECFAQSPLGSDDIFPHESIREVFEENYSEELEKGFHLGVVNSRGVYTLTNGKAEEEISKRYDLYARALRIDYPRMAQVLKGISDSYMRQSEADRERATHDY